MLFLRRQSSEMAQVLAPVSTTVHTGLPEMFGQHLAGGDLPAGHVVIHDWGS